MMARGTVFFCFCIAGVGFLLSACERSEPGSVRVKALADHHAHVLSSQLVEDWSRAGARFSKPVASYGVLPSGEGFVSGVGNFRVETEAAVSMAHIYGAPWFRDALNFDLDDERARVSNENDFAAQAAGDAPFFCSVPFARPYMSEEAKRCAETLHAEGLKIHLGAAQADFRDPSQIAALAELFGVADRHDMTVLLHLDPQRRGTEIEDVAALLDQAAGPYPDLRLIIAHLGGSGGYGPWTQSVFLAVNDWLRREEAAGRTRKGVYFDISAVILEEEAEGVPASTQEEIVQLNSDLRRVGFDRILFASDYPVFDPVGYAALLADALALTNDETGMLFANRVK